jgi:sugar transferase (PEP-CTERM system associated)
MFRIARRHFTSAEFVSVVAEMGSLLVVFWIAGHLATVIRGPSFAPAPGEFWVSALIFGTVVVLYLYLNGLYDFHERLATTALWIKLFRALVLSAVSLWVIYTVFPGFPMGRSALLPALFLSSAILVPWRHLSMAYVWRKVFAERVLVLGTDEASLDFATAIETREHEGFSVVGFLGSSPQRSPRIDSARVFDNGGSVLEVARAQGATRVVVAQADNRGQLSLDDLLECKTAGIRVERASEYYERLTGRVLLDGVRIKSWLVFSEGFVVSKATLLLKRTGDIVTATIGLVLAAPLMAVVALLVRIDSPGPILYRQERLGRNHEPFVLWKFRSMRQDAERGCGAIWATPDDDRVTRVGRLIRHLRLDELPQLWNVLRGDMSMVGPRPEREEFVQQLSDLSSLYEYRLAVRPGLTGWAQVKDSYASSFEESLKKLSYDLFYIKNISFLFDLSILASTVRIVLFGRGAR